MFVHRVVLNDVHDNAIMPSEIEQLGEPMHKVSGGALRRTSA